MSRIAESSQETQQQQVPSTPSRSKLVQRLLDAGDNLPQFLNDLLTTQAVLVAGTEAAAFLSERQKDQVALKPIAHIRPDDSDAATRQQALQAFQNIIQPCVVQGKDGAIEIGSPDGGDAQYCLVTILRNEGEVVGACAVIARARDLERAKQRLTSMQLVAGYFELFSLKRYVEQSRAIAERHQQVLQYAGAVATAEGFESAAMNLCNEMATRAGATRVAIGWLKGRRIRVKALSHTEKFDKKQELVVLIEKVMEECFDQEEAVRYDPNGDCTQNVTRAAAELSRTQGGNIVLSVPLRHREEIVGVMTVEWSPNTQIDDDDETSVGVAAELLAPQLYDRHENDRLIVTKAAHSVKWLSKQAVGPKHTGIKLLIVAVLGLVAFIVLFKPTYHVRAGVLISALDKPSICAPFDGEIIKASFRQGQTVKAGDVLARMRTDKLEMEYQDEAAAAKSKEIEAKKMRTENKMAEYYAADAEREMHEARAKRAMYDIKRADIKAPVSGRIVKGDLKDRIGQPVKEGEVLFEIARADEHDPNAIAVEAEIQVTERDIQDVAWAYAQDRTIDGYLATNTFPDQDVAFKITRIVPSGDPKDGENTFKVFARIEDPKPWMYPGLAGEARVNVRPQSLWWIWTHRLFDWIKLKVWSWT